MQAVFESPRLFQTNFGNQTVPAVPARQPAFDSEAGVFQNIAFALLMLDTFVTFSRVLEVFQYNLNISIPYLGSAIHGAVFLVALIAGGARRVGGTRAGVFLLLFTGWMIVCTPFSTWRGGSVDVIMHQWLPSLMGFLAGGLAVSLRLCRKLAATIGFSAVVVAATSFFLGSFYRNRLEFQSGTLGNANELAFILLLGAPFLLVPLFDPASKGTAKSLGFLAALFVVVVSFRTGSRANLLSLMVMLALLFWARPGIAKLKLLFMAGALGVILIATAPSYSLGRYAALFSDSAYFDTAQSEAKASGDIRMELLRQSVAATLQHPMFGVGPGVYMSAMADEAKKEGHRAFWKVSHNAYTQVSSEMGLPGLALYLGAICCTFLDILWLLKRRGGREFPPGVQSLGLCLALSLTGACVSLFFSSEAYLGWLPILMALSAMLRTSAQSQLSSRPGRAIAPGTTPRVAVSAARAFPIPAPVAMPAAGPQPAPSRVYRFLGRPQRIRR